MKIDTKILTRAAAFVTSYMEVNLSRKYVYHNLDHTLAVVNATAEICAGLGIKGHDKKVLLLAAWFHDLGYTRQAQQHEKHGAAIAEEFLQGQNIRQVDIDRVKACILATHYPQQPATLDERILCDADMAHLGKKNFQETVEPLRKEWLDTRDRSLTDAAWYQLNLEFLSQHEFHTKYARKHFSKQKEKNIKKLAAKLEEQNVTLPELNSPAQNLKTPKIVKGVETLIKNSSRNHMELSAMADNKAHILLSISSLIISVVLSFSIQGLDHAFAFVVPAAMLLLVCLTTIVFAVLTTRPKISKGTFTVEQIRNHEVNLLFFGNFHKMDLSVYEWGIHELMRDKEYLFNSMTKDVYYLGKVLAVKYRFLDIGYKVFMYGLIASVAAFSICISLNA